MLSLMLPLLVSFLLLLLLQLLQQLLLSVGLVGLQVTLDLLLSSANMMTALLNSPWLCRRTLKMRWKVSCFG